MKNEMNFPIADTVTTIFVDCFDTIIYRKVSKKKVFINWAQELSQVFNIAWRKIYKTYQKTNFDLCFKKLFSSFTLQENFEIVLAKMYDKLSKKDLLFDKSLFIKTAVEVYFKKELEIFYLNQKMLEFLISQKKIGRKIYLVSDFYCQSNIIKKWFEELKILDCFENVFSSSDFNKEKATTKIYKHLIEYLQLNPKNVIMLGDNQWSDVLTAKKCKLQAKRIKKLRRYNEI